MKQEEEEAIVSEALAFLQEHMRKKAAETDPASGFDTLKGDVKKHHGKEDERGDKSPNPPNIPSTTSERASFSEEKKSSVMDASIQELSTLLLECHGGPAKGVEGGENDPILVDLTDSADVLSLLKPPSQLEAIPKHFPYAMHLDVEVLHSVKEEVVPRVKDVPFIAEDPSLQSELIPKHPPRWFSNSTCSDSSDEEGEIQEAKEAEQKKKGSVVENGSHATFIAQDELLVQGFILSEPHSLEVELWMVETLQELLSPTLASLVCGFLNTAEGGAIYAGVKQNGEVRGLQMSNAERVHLGQKVQTLTNSLLLPRPPPTSIALNLLPVQTELKRSEVYVVRLLVKPVGNEREQFKVHNLGGGEGEGIFCRRGPGPQFNSTGVKKRLKLET